MLEELDKIKSPLVGREAIQKLFRVSRRQAHRLLATLDGVQVGRTYVVNRLELRNRLAELAATGPVVHELRRKHQVAEALELAEEEVCKRQAAAPAALFQPIAPVARGNPLPPGVELTRPGELRFRFETAEELLGHVLPLAEAAGRDYPGFTARLKRPS